MNDLRPDMLMAVSIPEACRRLGGCHASTIYRMRMKNQIVLVKLRGRTLVPVSEIARILGGTQVAVVGPVREPKKLMFLKRKLFPKVIKK